MFVSHHKTFCKDLLAFVLTFLHNAGGIWTISPDLKKNKLIGQGLADIRQRETPTILCKLDTHVLHSRSIRNTFARFAS